MNILVTGGAGFIGSHIVDAYTALGHRVVVLDNLHTGKRANVNPKAVFVKGDVQSGNIRALFKKHRFDAVNHHAAQIDVRKSVEDPAYDARVNILGLLNLLKLSREFEVGKFIFSASGGTFYGECKAPAKETAYPAPISPYGIAKLASEYYIKSAGELHGLKYTVLRYANVFGPRQDPRTEAGVVAIFSQGMLSSRPLFIFGDGKQQRDYVFVKDVAQASVQALKRGHDDVFNIGTGRATSVNGLFALIKKVTGSPAKPVYKPARPGEIFRSVLNPSKAKKGLGWAPKHSFLEGLRQTVDFFRENPLP